MVRKFPVSTAVNYSNIYFVSSHIWLFHRQNSRKYAQMYRKCAVSLSIEILKGAKCPPKLSYCFYFPFPGILIMPCRKIALLSKRILANSTKKFFAANLLLKEKCAQLILVTISSTREPKAKNATKNVH